MAKSYNPEYLRFDAFSIKNRIIKALSDNSSFTDQVFEGSNLAILIDSFSHLFETLTYYINHGASEAMFSDTVLFENMNRIVKLLGYNPFGHLAPQTVFSYENAPSVSASTIFTDSLLQKEIPKFAYVDTGLTDSRGNTVFYSMIETLFVNDINSSSDVNTFTAVNGLWKWYPRTFAANGVPFEQFILTDLILDETNDNVNYISHPYISLFVKTTDTSTGLRVFEEYTAVSEGGIFGTAQSVIGPTSRKFELRIDENKRYTIKFGDGVHGKKLRKGDEIYVVYLEGNGVEGEIGASVVNTTGAFQWGIDGIDTETFLEMIGITDEAYLVSTTEMQNLTFTNITASTKYQSMETVDSIRTNAPNYFKSGGRLVTASDFETFIRTFHSNDIYDVKVMNNWEYLSTFFKWLSDYGKLSAGVRAYDYPYADACDFNNVYVWVKKKIDINQKIVQDEMLKKKVLTCEPFLVDAIDVKFIPCMDFSSNASLFPDYDNLRYDIDNWDPNIENWIEVMKSSDSYYSSEKIQSKVVQLIRDFFLASSNSIGGTLAFNDLYASILAIDGVKYVRMAYLPTGSPSGSTVFFNGLSFAAWSTMIVGGRDVQIVKGTFNLEPFQFPILMDDDINSRVKVIAESFGQPSIEY